MTIYDVSNGAELASAVSSASAGDVIVLESGTYGDVSLSRDLPGEITIRSASPQAAELSSLNITGSNVRIEDVHVSGRITVRGANDVAIVNSKLDGFTLVRQTEGFEFDGNTVAGDSQGLFLEDTSRFRVTDNDISDIDADLIRVDGNSYDGLIENNVLRDMKPVKFPDGTTTHADAIQMFGRPQGDPHDIVIRGNYIYDDPNTGDTGNLWGQGIFLGGPVGVYRNITIEENLVAIGSPNSIFIINGGSGNVIRNNTVLSWDPGSGGGTIRVEGNSGGTLVEGNVALALLNNGGAEVGDNFIYSNNTSAANHWSKLFENGADGSSWEGFVPKDGSPIDFGSAYGAQDRLLELLGEAPPTPPVDPLDARDDAFSLQAGGVLNFDAADLIANDVPGSGGTVSILDVTEPASGTLTANADGTFVYRPDPGFAGTDSFRYTATDGNGETDQATVKISVTPVAARAPVAIGDAVSVRVGQPATFDVLANDTDPDGDSLTVTGFAQPASGNIVGFGGGRFTYMPAADFVGTDSFSYTISDPSGRTSTATVTLRVSSGASPILDVGPETFDGQTGSAVVLPHQTEYELAEGTISTTFTADTTSRFQTLMTKDASGFGDGGHIGLFLAGDGLRVRMQSSNDEVDFTIRDVVRAGVEHDLVVTFGTGGVDVYLDGERVGGDDRWTGGLLGNEEPIVLGANQWASSAGTADSLRDAFDGEIAAFEIYGSALSANEIAALAGSQPPPSPPETPPDPPVDEPGEQQEPVYLLPGPTRFDGSLADIVQVEHSDDFLFEEGSIGFSFLAAETKSLQGLVSKDARDYKGGGNHFSAFVQSDTLKVRFQGEDSQTILKVAIDGGKEHDVLATFGSGAVQLYLDGVLVDSDAFTMDWTKNVQDMQVGGLGWGSQSGSPAAQAPFEGTMSDVAIVDQVLTPSDFEALF